jgi:hypothetical protein
MGDTNALTRVLTHQAAYGNYMNLVFDKACNDDAHRFACPCRVCRGGRNQNLPKQLTALRYMMDAINIRCVWMMLDTTTRSKYPDLVHSRRLQFQLSQAPQARPLGMFKCMRSSKCSAFRVCETKNKCYGQICPPKPNSDTHILH